MATPYSDVFKRFKKRIEDIDLPNFTEEEQNEMLTEWLDTAIGYIELEMLQIKNDLSDRDNGLQEFTADLNNPEKEVIALYMVAAWYEPKINSLKHILMMVGSKDEKWTSQKEHMNMMIEARDLALKEARKYFLKYGSKNNTYLNGGD